RERWGRRVRASVSPSWGRLSGLLQVVQRAVFQRFARNDNAHDLVRAFENLMHARIAHETLERMVLEITVTAEDLLRLDADSKPRVGREALGHGGKRGGVMSRGVELRGGKTDHQARGDQLRQHVGEFELQRLKLGEL